MKSDFLQNSEKMAKKHVLIGLTGSIACYKICELIRKLVKTNIEVKVVVSPSALEFIGSKTFETLTNSPVYSDTFAPKQDTEHISLAEWADLFVIAPITANTISKFALGIADNLITSVFNAYLGSKKPAIIAPAMNTGMLNNPFVQNNIKALKNAGVEVVETRVAQLACGTVANGAMADVEKIYEKIIENLHPDCISGGSTSKKKILLTTGGTKEWIDPVRFISNASSGRMGTALADFAHKLGHCVKLISTVPVEGRTYNVTIVNSAQEMFEEVKKSFPDCDCLIMAAAVSDWKPKTASKDKISKEKAGETLNIELVQNPDILKEMGKIKKENQKTIGFSLGTNDVLETAKAKLSAKNADFIIANEAKTALNTEENEVWIIDKGGNIDHIEKSSKENVAKAILERVL